MSESHLFHFSLSTYVDVMRFHVEGSFSVSLARWIIFKKYQGGKMLTWSQFCLIGWLEKQRMCHVNVKRVKQFLWGDFGSCNCLSMALVIITKFDGWLEARWTMNTAFASRSQLMFSTKTFMFRFTWSCSIILNLYNIYILYIYISYIRTTF